MAKSPTPRQLIVSQPTSPFGEATLTEDQLDRGTTFQEDYMYVDGWSDMLHERDVHVREYKEGTRNGSDIRTLPGNVYLSRCAQVGGAMDAQKLMKAKIKGYRAVDGRPVAQGGDVGRDWLTKIPQGWILQPDNTIRSPAGDLQMMFADQGTAARNHQQKERLWLEQSGNAVPERLGAQADMSGGKEITQKGGNSVVDTPRAAKGNQTK